MVSLRCKMAVRDEVKKLGLHLMSVDLGELIVSEELNSEQREQLSTALKRYGLELLDDKKAIIIQSIKNIVVETVHYNEELPKVNFSDYLSEKLGYDYTYLSNLFSVTEGTTIEHYIIMHRIERVKELIIYDELNLSEIAWKLNYSSVAHLSHQFKKVTGLTPTFYKKMSLRKRICLEDV